MKLYYFPHACSQASNIALREAGVPFELVKVSHHSKKTIDGQDFHAINAKGYVPTLVLDDGETLTENVAVLLYVGDRNPQARLVPAPGTMERYHLIEWLAFINSEIHKNFSPTFRQDAPEETKQYALALLAKRLDFVQSALGSKTFLMGEQFTVADCYLFTVLSWAPLVKLDLGKWPELKRYVDRVQSRPKVTEALKSEGLIK